MRSENQCRFFFIPLFVGSKTPTSRFREKRCPALVARISGRFAPSDEAKSASLSGAWASCNSEQAASAFLKKIGGGQLPVKARLVMEVSLYSSNLYVEKTKGIHT
uniref:hypothetical protein n=1 Tax=Bacillus cytotoxicus TaxID=580165 RepID=UPI00203BDC75